MQWLSFQFRSGHHTHTKSAENIPQLWLALKVPCSRNIFRTPSRFFMHIQWRHLEVRVSDKQHSNHLKECFIDIQTYTTEQNISVFVHSPKPGLHWSLFISSHRQELDKANRFASIPTLEQEEKPSLRSQTAAFHKCITTSTRTGESVCVQSDWPPNHHFRANVHFLSMLLKDRGSATGTI